MHCRSSLVLSVAMGILIVCSIGCSPSGGGIEGSGGSTAVSSGGQPGAGGTVGTGGKVETGGASGTGGKVGTGGATGTGGNTVSGSGGLGAGGTNVQGSGGANTTGGRIGSGGTSASGGATETGGTTGRDGGPGGRDGGPGGRDGGPGGNQGTGGNLATGGTTGAGGSTAGGTGLAGAAVPSDGCGKATTAKTGDNQTITVGTSSRTYNLKLPATYDQNHPYRLIISYHWLNGTAANVSTGSGGTIKAWYDLDTTAASNGTTVFVAPQGLNNGWSNSGGADVTFSRTLITQLESTICIDKARIFAEGFSMGGSMSYAMASAAPEIIRAVAVHSGGAMSGSTSGHNKPVAYFMTHGTKDSVCTWTGQYGWPQLEDFAKVNGCKSPDPTLAEAAFKAALPQPTSTAGVCLDFTGCTAGYPTRSCLFVGDHTPSPDGTDGWVPKETWKFFSQF